MGGEAGVGVNECEVSWNLHDDDPVENIAQHEPDGHARGFSSRHTCDALVFSSYLVMHCVLCQKRDELFQEVRRFISYQKL
jgi:hypothetical protein